MALNIPTFPDPRDPANPLVNAYGFISEVTFSWFGPSRLILNVSPNAAAWPAAPVDQIRVKSGEILVPAVYDPQPPGRRQVAAAVAYPTFEELLQDPEFAAAFDTIGRKLQGPLLNHPKLAGATQV